jgi:hypothetical protein
MSTRVITLFSLDAMMAYKLTVRLLTAAVNTIQLGIERVQDCGTREKLAPRLSTVRPRAVIQVRNNFLSVNST